MDKYYRIKTQNVLSIIVKRENVDTDSNGHVNFLEIQKLRVISP